ncbi:MULTISPECIES: hydrolase [Pseudomonadati]|uniref:Hydrolase n=1 Tax=Shewanella aestuarii TaxID=1028752 RepID=A0ABT0KZQ3_9GAMM|nr:hydrolase [Shewanella aestuarii]MCL1116690.1 hydrolase [Shewanella aestuarii]
MPTKSLFTPPWWAANPHIQTILPFIFKVDKPDIFRQRQELPDGDFIDLDWSGTPQNGEPILVISHGLEGGTESHYARRMLVAAKQEKLCSVVHHHRSCSGVPNRLARSYHSGDFNDLAFTLQQLKTYYPDSALFAVGYSLGGNVLAKYQGTTQDDSLLDRAVVISAPLTLSACAKKLEKGFSKIYQTHLITRLQQKISEKIDNHDLVAQMPLSKAELKQLKTFYQFDDKVTAPLHGFNGVEDYYTRSSALGLLKHIRKPTLIIHAKDDPFMTDAVIPTQEELSDSVHYELHDNGGHVGFIDGGWPWKPSYYLEKRVLTFLLAKQPDTQQGDNL